MDGPTRKPAPDTTDPAGDVDDELAEELERRIRDTEAGGDQGTAWETVRARLKAKYGSS